MEIRVEGQNYRVSVGLSAANYTYRRGFPLVVDGDAGPATSHWIVVGLGQSDAICGANGYRQACGWRTSGARSMEASDEE